MRLTDDELSVVTEAIHTQIDLCDYAIKDADNKEDWYVQGRKNKKELLESALKKLS